MKHIKQWISKHPYLCYTGLFLLTCLGVFISFILAKKSFIWVGETKDGLVQHYNALMYFGRYLRYIVTHFEFPMWDFAMGYGADIISTLHYYCIGDPLNLLSIFVPSRYCEYLYEFLIILRLYLAGFTFIWYCRYMKHAYAYSILGAIVYVFCGYALVASVRHPYFINPMIYLPLLLIGVEKIYRKSSPILFVFSVFLSVISNFYFFYILCMVVVIYCIIRFFDYHHDHYIKNIGKILGQFLLYGVMGVLMSAVILIPVLILFFGTSRSQSDVYIPLFYHLRYYFQIFFSNMSVHSAQYWSQTMYTSLIFITTIMLFLDKQHRSLKIAFIVLTIGLCMPFFGSVMNGFSYITNRWIFAYSMLLAYIIVCVFPKLYTLKVYQFVTLFVIMFVYIGIILYVPQKFLETHLISIAFLVLMMIILLIAMICHKQFHLPIKSFVYCSLLFLVIINVCVTARLKYDSPYMHYVNEFHPFSKGYQTLTHTRYDSFEELLDNSEFYRIDEVSFGEKWMRNAGLQSHHSSLTFFYSLGNGYVSEFFKEMLNVNALSSAYTGVDYRTFLNTLASAKYFIAPDEKEGYVPYGYTLIQQKDQLKLYENQYALPLGYTYDQTMDLQTYESLSAIEKQEALLQMAVINDDSSSSFTASPQLSSQKISYEITDWQGMEVQGDQWIVKEKNAKLKIKIPQQAAGEFYTYFANLQYLTPTARRDKVNVKVSNNRNHTQRTLVVRTPYNSYYEGTTEYLLNMGYVEEGPTEITITFPSTGTYQAQGMQIIYQSMEYYQQYVEKLKENTLENIEIGTNKVTGTISLEKDKLLCLTIPYNKGWEAYVDGQKVDLYRVNTMYMGIPLEAGEHQIELRYVTPGLKVGLILSTVGWATFAIVFKKRKYQNV